MTYAVIKDCATGAVSGLVEIITIGSGSAPPRPTPGPIPPPGVPTHPIALPGDPWWGGGGPVDPGYGIPETGYPGNPPRPTHPIMLPGMPGWGENPPTVPTTPGPGVGAVVFPVPVTDPPTPPPAGMPPDSVQVGIWFGPGTKPAVAWVAPYASTGPVTPPAP